jgi:hypothetical protein
VIASDSSKADDAITTQAQAVSNGPSCDGISWQLLCRCCLLLRPRKKMSLSCLILLSAAQTQKSISNALECLKH